jgi:hypothetical protein
MESYYFSEEYLETCKGMPPEQNSQFLEDFRTLQGSIQMSINKLISITILENASKYYKYLNIVQRIL